MPFPISLRKFPPRHPVSGKTCAAGFRRKSVDGREQVSLSPHAVIAPSFEVLSTLVKALGVSFDAIFDPADEQVEAEIQEIAGLYRTCPEQGRRLILASTRTMAHEMMGADTK